MSTKTLYINNLNERIPPQKLSSELAKLVDPIAKPLKVIAKRGIRKRGQAFLLFRNELDAERVKENFHNVLFYKKKLQIAFAHKDLNGSETKHEQTSKSVQSVVHNYGEPHSVLLLQKIPDSVDLSALKEFCAQFAGFKEARMFAVKHVGFVDFDSVDSAKNAIHSLASSGAMGEVSYAKK